LNEDVHGLGLDKGWDDVGGAETEGRGETLGTALRVGPLEVVRESAGTHELLLEVDTSVNWETPQRMGSARKRARCEGSDARETRSELK
jgi:hypothetical protein